MRWLKTVYLLLGFGLLAVVAKDVDLAEVSGLVVDVGWVGVGLVVFIYFLGFLGDSISWSLILTSRPVSPTWFRRTFMVRLAGEAFNNVIPAGGFAGEPVKAVLLKRRYGVDYGEAAASIVMARTVNMIALIAFLMVGFGFMLADAGLDPLIRNAASVGLLLLSVGTVLLFALQRLSVSSWLMRRGWAAKLARGLAVAEDLDHRFVRFYTRHRGRLCASLILAFINWALGVAEIYVTFLFLGHEISWAEAWMIEAMTQMVRSAVFFIPLAVGAQEGTFVLITTAITGAPALGLACAAVRRIREIVWIALGLGAAALYPTQPKQDAGGRAED